SGHRGRRLRGRPRGAGGRRDRVPFRGRRPRLRTVGVARGGRHGGPAIPQRDAGPPGEPPPTPGFPGFLHRPTLVAHPYVGGKTMAGSREKTAAIAVAGTAAAAAAGMGLKRLRDGDATTFDSDSYRLLAGEPVAAGIKRLVAGRVDDAIAQLPRQAEADAAAARHH